MRLSQTRRSFLAYSACVAAILAYDPAAYAQTSALPDDVVRFLALSRKATAYDDLNVVVATRTYDALVADEAGDKDKLAALASLAEKSPDAKALKAAAAQAGLADALTAVLMAWYTGTVAGKKTVMIAYHDALMYRPVADGLVVPTYCDKGPLWWRDKLPPGVTRIPVNFPKVL